MMDNDTIVHDPVFELELANRQALKYGADLAQIYVAEKEKRVRLEVALQAINAIFTNIPDGLVVINDGLIVQQSNAAFNRLVELGKPSAVGLSIDNLLPPDQILPILNELTTNSHAPTQVDIIVEKPVKRSLLASFARLQAGNLRGWVIALHDQTNLKRLEHQKIEFINIAAHELRTPLAAILGYAELLEADIADGVTEAPGYDLIDGIIQGSKRLTKIVQELIDFAALYRGDIQEGIKDFRVAGLIYDVLDEFRAVAAEKEVALQFEDVDTFLEMKADTSLLRTALYQLVLNGINFNHAQGFVRIEALSYGDRIQIRVIDSGAGIPQTDLGRVFEPFYQVEEHNTRHIGGLGIGLSIANRSVTELGGELSVVSVIDKGSTFTIDVPVQQPIANQESVELEAELDSSHQQSLIYARDIQKLYQRLQHKNKELKDLNHQLDEANKLKSSFLGVIGHELRSPFVSVDFSLQIFSRLGKDNLTVEQQETFDQIKSGFKQARQLVDSLIEYAGLLSKQGRLNLQMVNVFELVQKVAQAISPIAEGHGLNLSVDVSPGLMLPAGDSERITEALRHLVHNAVKFTPSGGHVQVRAYQELEYILFEVKDDGPGIPVDKQANIWEPFVPGTDPLKRGVEGLGLGYALVHYVAVAHGGDVVLHSEPGLGTVIGFWLPMHVDKDEE